MKPTTILYFLTILFISSCETDDSIDVRNDCGFPTYVKPDYVSQFQGGEVFDSLKVEVFEGRNNTATLYVLNGVDFNVEKSFSIKAVQGVPSRKELIVTGVHEYWAKIQFLGIGYDDCPGLATADIAPGAIFHQIDAELVKIISIEEVK